MSGRPNETLETALVILSEWNANSKSPVAACKPDGQRHIRDAYATAVGLERIERSLRRMAIYACNFPMSDYEEARADKRAAALAAKAVAIAKPFGLTLKLGGDVRGSQVRIMTPKSDHRNTWGGAEGGWAV